MAFKQRSSGLPFKEMGSSPAKHIRVGKDHPHPHEPTKPPKHKPTPPPGIITPPKKKEKSPAKQKGDNLKRIMTENKIAAKKAGTWYKPGADPSGMPKNFNTKGSKGSTTPGYSTTKAARVKAHDAAINKLSTDPKTANLPKKEFDALLDKTSKKHSITKTAKKSSSKLPKNFNITGSSKAGKFAKVAKKQGKKQLIKKVVGKIGSRLIPGLGWGLAAYDAGKWVYKNRKDIKKHAKKVKDTRYNNPSDHGRPKY